MSGPMKIIFSSLVFVLFFRLSSAQYSNLVFEGAGIRGIAYGGVIEVLEKYKLIDSIKNVGGTSAGAITALCISLGYTSAELNALIYNTDFNKFNDGKYFFIGGLHRTNTRFGWYQGDDFVKWLEKIILDKAKNTDITFKELHDKGYKDLYITGTSLNRQKVIIFSRKSYPDMKVKDAVRISMSIPLYFEGVFIDSTGKVYEKQNDKNSLDLVVDGGILANFPITIFDSTSGRSPNEKRFENMRTIGVRIDSDEQIRQDTASGSLAPVTIENLNDYVAAMYILIIENLNRQQLTAKDWARTISVSSAGIGPKIKKLSIEQKDSLVKSGRKSAEEFLKKKK